MERIDIEFVYRTVIYEPFRTLEHLGTLLFIYEIIKFICGKFAGVHRYCYANLVPPSNTRNLLSDCREMTRNALKPRENQGENKEKIYVKFPKSDHNYLGRWHRNAVILKKNVSSRFRDTDRNMIRVSETGELGLVDGSAVTEKSWSEFIGCRWHSGWFE